jgi:hypothetical protein
MKNSSFLDELPIHSLDADSLAEWVIANPKLLPDLFDGANSNGVELSSMCTLALLKMSRVKPQLLYPYFHWFVDMLTHERVLLRRLASFALHHLASVDCQEKLTDFADLFSDVEMAPSRA